MAMPKPQYKIYTKIHRLEKEKVDRFSEIPVPVLADNMRQVLNLDMGIHGLNGKPMVGTAVTVYAPFGDIMLFQKAMDLTKPGDIIVVNAEGCNSNSFTGDVMVRYAMKKGIRGFVIDGYIRDIDEMIDWDFGLYARGIVPTAPYSNGRGEVNTVISAGGQVVRPGDIICCDGDGVIVVRREIADDVYEGGKAQLAAEKVKVQLINDGGNPWAFIDERLKGIDGEIIDDYAPL